MRGYDHVICNISSGMLVSSLLPQMFSLGKPITIDMYSSVLHATFSLLSPVDLLYKGAFYGGLILGALLPDLDHHNGIAGRYLPVVQQLFRAFVRHRTLTHSILGVLLAGLLWGVGLALVVLGLQKIGYQVPSSGMYALQIFYIALLLGLFLHTIEDMMTTRGVTWFYPLRRQVHFPLIRFRTGSIGEHLVVSILILSVVMGFFFRVVAL